MVPESASVTPRVSGFAAEVLGVGHGEVEEHEVADADGQLDAALGVLGVGGCLHEQHERGGQQCSHRGCLPGRWLSVSG
jgi:hypothetical protein